MMLTHVLATVLADEPKGVSVSLRVKWPGTSVLLEAAEFLVRINDTALDRCGQSCAQPA